MFGDTSEGSENLGKILCPFCSRPWDEQMVELYAHASSGCDTCGPEIEAYVDITCGGCKRTIYRKEY